METFRRYLGIFDLLASLGLFVFYVHFAHTAILIPNLNIFYPAFSVIWTLSVIVMSIGMIRGQTRLNLGGISIILLVIMFFLGTFTPVQLFLVLTAKWLSIAFISVNAIIAMFETGFYHEIKSSLEDPFYSRF